jgi:pimeloyl-ACP methyl ester carboxylesterase
VAHVVSKDGTKIAYEIDGTGPALVIVSGALSSRELLGDDNKLVEKLAESFTVYTYDRRGRGESGDVQPYSVQREIEDIDALIAHAGTPVHLFGVSSGAALAMQATAKLGAGKVARLALYEPPYGQEAEAFAKQKQGVAERTKNGKPGDAAEAFLASIGTPRDALDGMKRSPQWAAMAKMDFTLNYDFAVLGDGQVPEEVVRAIAVPTLVMTGEKSMPFMAPTADRIASLMPNGQRRTLAGQTHQVQGDVVAPIVSAFFISASPTS